MRDDNEIWDEFKWEEFMKEQDRKVDRYMELFYKYQNHPDRDELIAREMGWTWLLDKRDTDEFGPPLPQTGEVEEGDEWKVNAGIPTDHNFDFDSYKTLPVFQRAHRFAVDAMKFVDQLSESARENSVVVEFISNAMVASAKIAGGTGLGDDLEDLGGNIAYCKRGLAAANLAIAALHEMRERKILVGGMYLQLMEEATEVRNAIALHVIELREKFRRDSL